MKKLFLTFFAGNTRLPAKANYKTAKFSLKNSVFILLLLLIPLGFSTCSSDDDLDGSDSSSGDSKGTHNGHEYVDLGLSVKWATCNIGASSVHDAGNYYQWGGTTTKSNYSSSNCDTYGVVLYDISGDEDYDVARAKWGGKWRMPTKDEVQELIDNCDVDIYEDGVEYADYVFVGSNGNYIWMPLTGYYSGTELKSSSNAYFWTSTYYIDTDYGEKDFLYESTMFISSFNSTSDKAGVVDMKRWYGAPIRPVFDDEEEEEEEYSYDATEIIDGYEAVDLGLSVKWARCNIGATEPWDYGNYYAYHETSTKTTYTESNYNNSGADTATQLWGEKWRLPTQDELQELFKLNSYNTSENGINGARVTNSTGNSLFFPAAGYKSSTSIDKNLCGYYWTSTSKSYYYLYILFFSSENAKVTTDFVYQNKWVGCSVRPVTDY